MKLLTIVIPVYNMEKYLRRCLDSILIDDIREDLEVLAVNDGSKDNSVAIIREYESRYPDIVHLIDKENGGHGSTINAGLKEATGKYFRVLDSDDWFDTLAFISYITKLKKCDEDLIVTPYTVEYVYNGRQVSYNYKWLEHNRTIPQEEIIYDGHDQYFTIHSSTFKTDVLREAHLRLYEKCFYVDMQYIIMPIPYVKTVRVLDDTVYRYYIGRPEQSMSPESMKRNFPQHQKVLVWVIDFYAANRTSLPDNIANYIAQIAQFMYYTHLNLIRNNRKNRLNAYKNLVKLESHVKDVAPELYTRLASYPYLRQSRKINYINILAFDKSFFKIVDYRQKHRH